METKQTRPWRTYKVAQSIRFYPAMSKRLAVAAKQLGMSKTAYVEAALRAALEKDGIK